MFWEITMYKQVYDIVFKAIKELYVFNGLETELTDESIIFGEGSALDSLDLVNGLLTIESEIGAQLNVSVEVIDEDSIISEDSPFQNIDSLTRLLVVKVNDAA